MTDLPVVNQETYIGDGVYISFDGYHIKLRAPREDGDHYIALEQTVYRTMLEWVALYPVLWEYFAATKRSGEPYRKTLKDT